MYSVHPFIVHFPIGLLLACLLFTVISLRRGEPSWEISAYHCLIVGWFGSVAAVLSGLIEAALAFTGPAAAGNQELLGLANAHAFTGIAVMVIYGRALLLRRRNPALLSDPQARRGYLGLLIGGALLIVVGGWLGGNLSQLSS
jgi:uncharacterized membrane protein